MVCLSKLFSQINLVNNGSFEYGSTCFCKTEPFGTRPDLRAFDWSIPGPKYKKFYPTPDWFLFPYCFKNRMYREDIAKGYFDSIPKLFSSGIVGMYADTQGYLEGLQTTLKENLKPGSTYLMRMKIGLGLRYFKKVNGAYHIAIHFSKFQDDWTANPNTTQNVLWENAFKFRIDGSNVYDKNEFIPVQIYFKVPNTVNGGTSAALSNLTIRQYSENWDSYKATYAYIDDVELYEVSDYKCNANWVVENRVYEYHELPVEASGEITAGKNVLDNNDNGPVICDAKQDSAFGDSRLEYKAGKRVRLKDGFKVEKEAYFRAYLAPCGKEFFDPIADLGITDSVITICGDVERCLDLGSKKAYNMTYEWSSNDAAIMALLNGKSTLSQISLCIPRSMPSGTYRLKYKVTNGAGAVAEKSLRIYINRSPFTSSPVMYHMSGVSSWGGYYFNGLKSHDKFFAKYRVYYCDEILMEVLNEDNTIIDSKRFYIDIDYPNSMTSSVPFLNVLYYKDVPCGNYRFKFTMINTCTGTQNVYIENTRYHCQFD
ncbi:MAG TPA: hypothetical protein VGF79_01575 [Bacteroidia bacterium]